MISINTIIPMIDLIKSREIISSHEIGKDKTEETSGAQEGINRSFQIKLSDGKTYLWKPKSGEHDSKWRLMPSKSQYLRERAAFLISERLGFNLVPKVENVRSPDGLGSLQQWVEGEHVFGDYMEFINGLDEEQKIKIGIFDMILGNSDRHGQNFLVSLEEV